MFVTGSILERAKLVLSNVLALKKQQHLDHHAITIINSFENTNPLDLCGILSQTIKFHMANR